MATMTTMPIKTVTIAMTVMEITTNMANKTVT